MPNSLLCQFERPRERRLVEAVALNSSMPPRDFREDNRLAAFGEPRITPESDFRRIFGRGAVIGVSGFPVSRSSARRPLDGVRLGVPVMPEDRGERTISASMSGGV